MTRITTTKSVSDDPIQGIPSSSFLSDERGPIEASLNMEIARAVLAEFLSAALQVGISVSATQLYLRGAASTSSDLMMIAFAQFVSYMAATFVFSPHSVGFGSPLLLWASCLVRQSPTVRRRPLSIFMIVLGIPLFQFGGSMLGVLLGDVLIGKQLSTLAQRRAAVPTIGAGVAPAAAFFVEATAVFWLILVMTVPQNTARLYTPAEGRQVAGGQAQSGEILRPLVAGLVFTILVFGGGALVTGVAISPFRWLAPAMYFNVWGGTHNWWVHTFGPLLGWLVAVFCGLFFHSSSK